MLHFARVAGGGQVLPAGCSCRVSQIVMTTKLLENPRILATVMSVIVTMMARSIMKTRSSQQCMVVLRLFFLLSGSWSLSSTILTKFGSYFRFVLAFVRCVFLENARIF